MGAVRGELLLQLRQSDIARLGERRMDEPGMSLRSRRQAISPHCLGSGIAHLPPQGRPADRARRAHPETLGRLTARQAAINGSQDARAKIKRKWLGHPGWPPSPARTVNQIRPDLGTRADSTRANSALAGNSRITLCSCKVCQAGPDHEVMKGPDHVEIGEAEGIVGVHDGCRDELRAGWRIATEQR